MELETELQAALLDQAPDAVIFAGPDGAIRYWNEAATRIFGFTAEEALGKSLDIIIPEQFREAHWRGFDRAMAAKETKYSGQALATRSHTADGRQIYVELSFGIVLVGSEAVGALAQARDITERFERDRETRRRLRELEAAAREREGGA